MSQIRIITIVVVVLAVGSLFAAMTLKPDHDQPAKEQASERPAVTEGVLPDQGQPGERLAPEGTPPESRPEVDGKKGKKADDERKSPEAADAKKPGKPGKGADQRPANRPGPGGDPALAEYRHTFQLMRMFMAISMIERTGQNALKPAQAKQVLSILTPLRSKPKLTQDDAEKAVTRLKKVLTANQFKAIDSMRSGPRVGQGPDGPRQVMPPGMPGQRPPQGPPPPGQNGVRREGPPPGGPPGAPGERRAFRQLDPKAMKDFNPFYSKPPKGNEMLEAQARHMDQFFAGLERKAM